MTAINTYEVESMVCGYHVYRDVWEAAVGQTLYIYTMSTGSRKSPQSIHRLSYRRWNNRWPRARAISAVRSLFLRRNGTILCELTWQGANHLIAGYGNYKQFLLLFAHIDGNYLLHHLVGSCDGGMPVQLLPVNCLASVVWNWLS